jgi:hypothetical protein
VILEHYRLAEQLYDSRRCGQLMRKFGIKYAALHPDHHQVRQAFAAVGCREDWEGVLRAWYKDDLPGCYPDPAIHRISCDGLPEPATADSRSTDRRL